MSKSKKNKDQDDNIIEINRKKCIGCTACASTCAQETKISALKTVNNGKITVAPKQGKFASTGCIYCGQCTLNCPTEAINTRNDINLVKQALSSGKYLIATASSPVKATLGEEFNLPIGTNYDGKITPSAKKLGFQNVFDTDFGADMTALEEATELIKRIAKKENLPMFTSSCPSWIRYAEMFHPEILKNISTSKSPQQMMGVSIKTYFADTYNVLPNNIFTLSIEPCTAKKYEAQKYEMRRDGYKDIDAVLTVREYANLLKENGIDVTAIPDEKPDLFMGEYTGAAVIFGISGGAMQAILRTVASYLKGDTLGIQNLVFNLIDGYEDIKEAIITLGGQQNKVAIVNGLKEIEKFLTSGKWNEYLFIEVMACNGGCINGGGAPKIKKKAQINENLCIACSTCIDNCPVNAISYNSKGRAEVQLEKCVGCNLCSNICRADAVKMQTYDSSAYKPLEEDYKKLRADVLKNIDNESTIRISDENENLQNMYKNYMEEPDGDKAKTLLHTNYSDRSSEIKNNYSKKVKKN